MFFKSEYHSEIINSDKVLYIDTDTSDAPSNYSIIIVLDTAILQWDFNKEQEYKDTLEDLLCNLK